MGGTRPFRRLLAVRVALLIARSRLRRNMGATLALIVLAGLGGGARDGVAASIRRAEAGWDALQADSLPLMPWRRCYR